MSQRNYALIVLCLALNTCAANKPVPSPGKSYARFAAYTAATWASLRLLHHIKKDHPSLLYLGANIAYSAYHTAKGIVQESQQAPIEEVDYQSSPNTLSPAAKALSLLKLVGSSAILTINMLASPLSLHLVFKENKEKDPTLSERLAYLQYAGILAWNAKIAHDTVIEEYRTLFSPKNQSEKHDETV